MAAPLTEPVQITAPGVYDLSNDDYHADPVPGGSLSSTGARMLLPPSCPAKFQHWRTHPQPTKTTFEHGHVAHKLVLGDGPHLVVVDAADWRTKAAQTQRNAARAAGAVPILQHDYDQVRDMAAAIRRHPIAGALLDPDRGSAEQSLFWVDPTTSIWCRARLDWLPDRTGGRTIIADYKGLALDTKIPTPTGWTNMRDLSVGDQVFGSNGKPCAVTAKSEVHYRNCYRMRFDDTTSVICDDEHRWLTTSGRIGKRYNTHTRVRTTDEIRKTLRLNGQRHHRIDVTETLHLPEADLPIHPYVLGCWIGDGTVTAGKISKPDDELFDHIAACGYEIGAPQGVGTSSSRTIYGLQKQLRLAGLLGHKEIPDEYLRSSHQQRIALLRGLMDTDGSWNSARQQAIFTTTDKALAEAVRELVCSVGQRSTIAESEQHGFGITVTAYQVHFTPIHGLNPFLLSRKANKVHVRSEAKARRRLVTGVESVLTVPTQCISVDSPDNTYLCTEAMIPTHNTSVSAEPAAFAKSVANYGYHQQADWYLDAALSCDTADDPAFVFIVQEKTPPYVVTVVELDRDALKWGSVLNTKARDIYRECTTTGVWPGYADDVTPIALPIWAERAHEDAREQGVYDTREGSIR